MANEPTPGASPKETEALRVAAQPLAGQKKIEFQLAFDKAAQQDPWLNDIREKVESHYMNSTEGTVNDAVDYFKSIVNVGTARATQKLEQKAAANVQSAQGSGPAVDDTEKQMFERAFKSKGSSRDIQAILKARQEKRFAS